jgi:hypothetical protein
MPSISAANLPPYRRALNRATHAWYLLAAHGWVRLIATLRQTHNVGLSERFVDDPDIPRLFPEACASFQKALRRLNEFDEVPIDSPWLWCGGQTLTSSGPPPDLDSWLDSLKGIGPDDWEQSVVGPFLACAGEASRQFQAFTEHFEQVKEEVIAASDNRIETRLQVSKALQQLQTEQHCRQEEQAQRRKRLYDLLTAAVASTQLTNEPAEEWARRLAERLAGVGQELRAQQWEDWLKATAEGEDFAQEFAELMLGDDQDRIARAVKLLPNLPTELAQLHEWLKALARDWSKVFDQGWLRWKLNRDLPPPTALEPVNARPAPQNVQVEPEGDQLREPTDEPEGDKHRNGKRTNEEIPGKLSEDVRVALAAIGTEVAHAVQASEQRLEELAQRLSGWAPGANRAAVFIDFLASEYGWTVEHYAELTDAQVVMFTEAALRRTAARAAGDRKSPAAEEATKQPHPAQPAAELLSPLPALLSAADLARLLGQPTERVDTFLRRFRRARGDCYIEVDNRRKNEPQFLYRTADVLPALQQQLPAWQRLTDG